MKEEREKFTEKIVESESDYKIIVAGPGTGKSFTMLQIMEKGRDKKYLLLTLTNELINDLDRDLGDHANCLTLHSFCLEIFKNTIKGTEIIFPEVQRIINYDAAIVGKGDNLSDSIKDFIIDDNNIKFYFELCSYYNALCFDSLVYKVASFLGKNTLSAEKYDLVLIDEYQDFNKVENELVKVLEHNNKILIVGDDDQSIYGFRKASPAFLREKYKEEKYEKFSLPYCSRCTNVIINSVNEIVNKAKEKQIFIDRIEKDYKCFLPDKQKDNDKFPKILHKCFSVQSKRYNYMADYIIYFWKKFCETLKETSKEKGETLILIIGPVQYLRQMHEKLVEELGVDLVSYKKREHDDSYLLNGLKLISSDQNSNLGWRIILEKKKKEILDDIIKKIPKENIVSSVDNDFKASCYNIISILNNPNSNIEDKGVALEFLSMRDYDYVISKWNGGINEANFSETPKPIKLTSFEGSKGLSAEYVFIVGLEEGVLPKSNKAITENDICKFIVALTRTKKQCHIFTCCTFAGKSRVKSNFLAWIPKSNVDYEYMDATQMRNLSQ